MQNKIDWCLKIKNGLRIVEPNSRLSKSYLKQSKASLLRANKNFEDKDLLWTTITIYYSEYYALYSFLQKIGIKCENHQCSIIVADYLLNTEKINIIREHKNKRIDAQYYISIDQEDKIKDMLNEAQNFISYFDELVSNISEEKIKNYRTKIIKEK